MVDNLHPYDFFFEVPLYTKIVVKEDEEEKLKDLLNFQGSIHAYNPILKENSTYKVSGGLGYTASLVNYENFRQYKLKCVRNGYEITCFTHLEIKVFEDESGADHSEYTLQKIGQLPTIADLHISQIREYDKVLSRPKIKEFTRAIGLAAAGVGIGSFVYLRRIFEDLIEEAHQVATQVGSFDQAEYERSRMKEKIELLKDHLPSFLVTNKHYTQFLA